MNDVEIVTEQSALVDYCSAWRAAGCFACDTEFIRDDTYEAASVWCRLRAARKLF